MLPKTGRICPAQLSISQSAFIDINWRRTEQNNFRDKVEKQTHIEWNVRSIYLLLYV